MSKKIALLLKADVIFDNRVKKIAGSFSREGLDVAVYYFSMPEYEVLSPEEIEKARRAPDIKMVKVDTWDTSVGLLDSVRQNRASRAKLIKRVLEEGADLVYSNDLNTLYEGVALKRRLGVPLIYDSHEFATEIRYPPDYSTRRGRLYWKWLESRLARKADVMVTVCDLFADRFASEYRVKRPVVMHNAPPLREITPLEGLRERLDVPAGKKLFVYVGTLSPGRGAEILIEAVKIFSDNVFLAIIGIAERTYREQLLRLAAVAGSDRVRLYPALTPAEVLPAYAASDAAIIFYESRFFANNSLSNKLFEIMMAGCPIIGIAMSETQRVIREVGSGLPVEEQTAEAVAAAIDEMASAAPGQIETWKKNALEGAKLYNWDVQFDNLKKRARHLWEK